MFYCQSHFAFAKLMITGQHQIHVHFASIQASAREVCNSSRSRGCCLQAAGTLACSQPPCPHSQTHFLLSYRHQCWSMSMLFCPKFGQKVRAPNRLRRWRQASSAGVSINISTNICMQYVLTRKLIAIPQLLRQQCICHTSLHSDVERSQQKWLWCCINEPARLVIRSKHLRGLASLYTSLYVPICQAAHAWHRSASTAHMHAHTY